MNANYKFRLHVEMPNGEHRLSAIEVAAHVASESEWSPYDLCSDSITAMIADGVTTRGAARIDAEREKLAKEIADALTRHILNAIKSRDLRNGYQQERTPLSAY